MAIPGAGKTIFTLRITSELLSRRIVERIIVVVPTEYLKVQWAASAAHSGIALDPKFSNAKGMVNPSYQGIVVTYAQVAVHLFEHHAVATARPTLVILDRVHHGGDVKSWGDGISEAYDDVERHPYLTGTPFRSDNAAIPFVRYSPDGDGYSCSVADYTYGYSNALADGVIRPVVFLAYSGRVCWRDSAGDESAARLGTVMSPEETTRAWCTALDPKGEWMPSVLRAAHTHLPQMRQHISDTGSLVVAPDAATARAHKRILEQIASAPMALVLSDEPGSSERIKTSSESTDEWMVAVRMVSEGADVPWLVVGVYATSSSTPLFFAQAIERFVRSRMPRETASIFLPSIPVLLDLASQMEIQRNHVFGKSDRPSEGWEDDLVAEANRHKDEPDELLPAYESIGADTELDYLIYDGSSYGTTTIAGSAEEANYLGLLGLLDADQMRLLLRQRQDEQFKAASAREKKAREKARESSSSGGESGVVRRIEGSAYLRPQEVASGVLPKLWKGLNTLMSMAAARTGKPHGQVHNEVRRACGGLPTVLCTEEQLRDRISYLRNRQGFKRTEQSIVERKMSASSNKSRPSESAVDGLSAVSGSDDRTTGVLALIFDVGGLSMPWVIVGGILGIFGIVLGIIAMAKAMSVKKRVQAAGGEAAISGSFGLGIVGIVTGIAVVMVSLMLYALTSDVMSRYEKYERTMAEYTECISEQMDTDQPKDQQ